MTKRIKLLEQKARKLEPAKNERQQLTEEVLAYAEDFLEELDDLKAYRKSAESENFLCQHPISEKPEEISRLLELLRRYVDSPGLNPASGNHMGYIPGGSLYTSALGDFLAAVTNRYAGVFFSSPGAVRIEHECIRWMSGLIGFPKSASGTLTSGGSIANMTAVVAARDAVKISSREIPKTVIYATPQAHHSLNKAFSIAGLKEAVIRKIPMDDRFRMIPEALEQQIKTDREKNLRPFLLVASAGSTDTGAVDPLQPLAQIAKNYQLWFHVDAAYGGAFLLTNHGKDLMQGIEQADSVIIDPHKGFFLPYGTGAVLVRDGQKLFESQHMTAGYMQDTLKADEEYSPADLSPELSRHFRGLRMWLPLKLYGTEPFAAALDEKLELSRYFHAKISNVPDVETGPKPDLTTTFFRYIPDSGDANQFNRRLTEEIHRDGRIFVSSTTINGKIFLRTAILNYRTHLEQVDRVIDITQKKINLIENKQQN